MSEAETKKGPRLVIIESPYAGDVEKNVAYARRAVKDSLLRGEAPFASHLLYTQASILDDLLPAERNLGMMAGFAWGKVADATIVYTDLGITPGMKGGITRAQKAGRSVEYRSLANAETTAEPREPGATGARMEPPAQKAAPRPPA